MLENTFPESAIYFKEFKKKHFLQRNFKVLLTLYEESSFLLQLGHT